MDLSREDFVDGARDALDSASDAARGGARRSVLFLGDVVTVGEGEDECPRCESALEPGYVRDPHSQEHWRGVKALVCPDCEYAEEA